MREIRGAILESSLNFAFSRSGIDFANSLNLETFSGDPFE